MDVLTRNGPGLLAALAVLVLAACSSTGPGESTTPSPSPSFGATVVGAPETPLESILRLAKENGAAPGQIAILEVAAQSDVVTFDQLRAAVDETFRCLDAADIEYIQDPVDVTLPLPVITYRIGVPTPESDRLSDECVYAHSFFVESAYLNQPAALSANEAQFTNARPHFIECLNDAGYPVDDSATNDELKNLIVLALTGSGIGSADDPPPGFVPVDCLSGTGVTGF